MDAGNRIHAYNHRYIINPIADVILYRHYHQWYGEQADILIPRLLKDGEYFYL